MSQRMRPVGLTALAVLNLVVGGSAALFCLCWLAGESNALELAKAWDDVGGGLFYFSITNVIVCAGLLVASGVGYLQQKKVLGRGLGNACAILSILHSLVYTLVCTLAVTGEVGGGFNTGTILDLVYALLTLALLNTTFKHDFTR